MSDPRMLTHSLRKRWFSRVVAVSCFIVLVGVALSPRFASWRFELRVSEGLPRDIVVQRLGADYALYTKDNQEELQRHLLHHTPHVNFGVADSIMVYALGLDRLGIVLLSVGGKVLDHFVVRT